MLMFSRVSHPSNDCMLYINRNGLICILVVFQVKSSNQMHWLEKKSNYNLCIMPSHHLVSAFSLLKHLQMHRISDTLSLLWLKCNFSVLFSNPATVSKYKNRFLSRTHKCQCSASRNNQIINDKRKIMIKQKNRDNAKTI